MNVFVFSKEKKSVKQVTPIIVFQIKGSLGMNTLSAVVGGIGTIISTVELTVELKSERRCLIFVSVCELL